MEWYVQVCHTNDESSQGHVSSEHFSVKPYSCVVVGPLSTLLCSQTCTGTLKRIGFTKAWIFGFASGFVRINAKLCSDLTCANLKIFVAIATITL